MGGRDLRTGSMSRPAVTVAAATSLDGALHLMTRHRIHYLPVVDAQAQLIGVVNVDDVLGTRRGGRPPAQTVAEVMSAPAVSVGPAESLEEAMRLMAARGIAALPVLEGGQVIGILTQSDVVTALAHQRPR